MKELTSEWNVRDYWGTAKVRLGFSRMNYAVEPGLYSLNNPSPSAPVLVTANYKLTVDLLRKELRDLSCHILVLDTRGINVWCAAGKGTFGTVELIDRIETTGLANKVTHRKLLLPQLGAPGVSGDAVRRETGFRVIFGPVEARDISRYIRDGWSKTESMRTKEFPVRERLVLTPLELKQSRKILFPAAVVLAVITGLSTGWGMIGPDTFLPLLLGVISGCFLTPLLLPLLPFRAFSAKGAVMGAVMGIIWYITAGPSLGLAVAGGGLLLSLSSFGGMNFTGASTYTSLSGVMKEMKCAVPLQIVIAMLSVAGGMAAYLAERGH